MFLLYLLFILYTLLLRLNGREYNTKPACYNRASLQIYFQSGAQDFPKQASLLLGGWRICLARPRSTRKHGMDSKRYSSKPTWESRQPAMCLPRFSTSFGTKG